MRYTKLIPAVAALALVVGCSTSPKTQAGRTSLEQDAQSTVTKMQGTDPTLGDFLNRSYGYVVFPSVGKGGLIVGGSYGKGVVYERGTAVGYADLSQATVGAQIGGQSFSQILAFQTAEKFNDFKSGNFTFNANASAVAIKAGAAAATDFSNGTAVFTMADAGLMAEASVGGQRFTYQPLDAVPASSR